MVGILQLKRALWLALLVTVLVSCGRPNARNFDDLSPHAAPPEEQDDYTRGVYEPFATDGVAPYVHDQDMDWYPLYYYY